MNGSGRFAFEQIGELGEGGECRRRVGNVAGRSFVRYASYLVPLMFIVVAIEAEEFPVAAVWRIVVVVVVFVVNRELAQPLAVEFASAVRADPRKEFERLFTKCLFSSCNIPLGHTSLAVGGGLVQKKVYSKCTGIVRRVSGRDRWWNPILTRCLSASRVPVRANPARSRVNREIQGI